MGSTKANSDFNKSIICHQAITLTTRESYQVNSKQTFKNTLLSFAPWLDKCCKNWHAYPELAPKNQFLHWHIHAQVTDFVKFAKFKGYWARNWGFQLVKTINQYKIGELEGWKQYIEKDWFPRSLKSQSEGHSPGMQEFLKLQTEMRDFTDHINKHTWKRFCPPIKRALSP